MNWEIDKSLHARDSRAHHFLDFRPPSLYHRAELITMRVLFVRDQLPLSDGVTPPLSPQVKLSL